MSVGGGEFVSQFGVRQYVTLDVTHGRRGSEVGCPRGGDFSGGIFVRGGSPRLEGDFPEEIFSRQFIRGKFSGEEFVRRRGLSGGVSSGGCASVTSELSDMLID